jgi:hypothetical protein
MAEPSPLPSLGTQMNSIIDSAGILDLSTRKHIARIVMMAHKNNRTATGKLVIIEDPHTKYLSVILDHVEDSKIVEQIYRLVANLKEHLGRPVDH